MISQGVRVFILTLLSFMAGFADADADLKDFKATPGSGAEYDLEVAGSKTKLAIYFVESSNPSQVAFEMFFSAPGSLMPIQLWQRFHLEQRSSGSPLNLKEGFIYSSQFKTRKLDKEYLSGFEGVQLNQFLVSSEQDLKKHLVGVEGIVVGGQEIEGHHYRIERNGQTVDFWVHHESKPIGLVKMRSSGSEMKHNYQLGLRNLVRGVKAKIDPKVALPMDDKTRSFLPKPQSSTGLGMF